MVDYVGQPSVLSSHCFGMARSVGPTDPPESPDQTRNSIIIRRREGLARKKQKRRRRDGIGV